VTSRTDRLEEGLRSALEAAEYFRGLVARLSVADGVDDLRALVDGINGDLGKDFHGDRGRGPWSRLHRAQEVLDEDPTPETADEEVLRLREEIRKMRDDLAAAAGELLVRLPEPGTDMARLLSANVLLKRFGDKTERRCSEVYMALARHLVDQGVATTAVWRALVRAGEIMGVTLPNGTSEERLEWFDERETRPLFGSWDDRIED
jgi:hypothetical protein